MTLDEARTLEIGDEIRMKEDDCKRKYYEPPIIFLDLIYQMGGHIFKVRDQKGTGRAYITRFESPSNFKTQIQKNYNV